MTLAPLDVELIEQWTALGGVPDDHSTRDHACRLLLRLWEDRQAWVRIAEQLIASAPTALAGDRSGPVPPAGRPVTPAPDVERTDRGRSASASVGALGALGDHGGIPSPVPMPDTRSGNGAQGALNPTRTTPEPTPSRAARASRPLKGNP